MTRRVVVTGLGCVSPVGNNVPDTWSALLAGKSGAVPSRILMPASIKRNSPPK